MSEARKLETSSPPDATAQQPEAPPPRPIEADLSPLIVEQTAVLTGESRTLEPKLSKRKQRRGHSSATGVPRAPLLDRASNAMMVLFLSGLFSFLLGTAMAAAIVLGLLDLQTGWVKELLKVAKEIAKSAGFGGGMDTPDT